MRGTQRHQAHSGADLIGHPTEQIALAQSLSLHIQATASPAPGRRPAQIQGAIGQGPAQLHQQLQQRATHLPLLLTQLQGFSLRQQPTIEIAQLRLSFGISSGLPLLKALLHGFQRSGLQPHDPLAQLSLQPITHILRRSELAPLHQHLQSFGVAEGANRQGRTDQLQQR